LFIAPVSVASVCFLRLATAARRRSTRWIGPYEKFVSAAADVRAADCSSSGSSPEGGLIALRVRRRTGTKPRQSKSRCPPSAAPDPCRGAHGRRPLENMAMSVVA
jgi:hypothetical protein